MSSYESASGLVKRAQPVPLRVSATRLAPATANTFHADIVLANTANVIPATAFPNQLILLTANGANTPAALPAATSLIPVLQAAGYKAGDAAIVKLMNIGTQANTIYIANGANTLIRSGNNLVYAVGTVRDIVLVYANSTNVDVY